MDTATGQGNGGTARCGDALCASCFKAQPVIGSCCQRDAVIQHQVAVDVQFAIDGQIAANGDPVKRAAG